MALVRLALRNVYLVIVLSLLVVVLGTVALARMPTDLLPLFKQPAIQILTLYPGMPAEVMERDIMSRLERWTGQANGIEHQEARAMPGVCVVKDFFHEEIDASAAMAQVSSLAMSDLYYLPPGTVPPMVMPFDPTASIPLCLVSVSSPTMSEKQLYDLAYYEMRNQLQAIPGVIAPAVYGGVLRRIHVYVDPKKLEARGLSPMDVVNATNNWNVLIPTGSAKFGDQEYMITSNAMVPHVADLDDIPVAIRDGQPVFVRDVGYAKDSQQIQTNVVRVNGRRQVYIPIYRQPGANTLEIVDTVRSRTSTILQRIKSFFPEAADVRLDVVMDQSVGVRNSIGELERAALLGVAFVVLVVMLFLGSVRSTAIVLLSLPLSVLAAFVGLYFTGNTINSMTLGGLSLAVGIMMEQSIVVLENISRHMAEGASRLQASLHGAGEVAVPVLVSTLTTVIVFFPVVFLHGIAGFLFTPLALAVTFALAASYFVALLLVPAACSHFLVAPAARAKNSTMAWIMARYEHVVGASLRAWPIVLVGVVLLIAAGSFGARRLGTELFPAADAGQFTILVRAPSGTRIERTEDLMRQVEGEVAATIGRPDPAEEDPESDVRMLISNIGVLFDWPAAYTPNAGSMDAFMLVQLKADHDRSPAEDAELLRTRLRDRFPGVEFAFDTGGILTAALNGGLPSPIEIEIQGSKLEILDTMAHKIANAIADVPGARDVRVAQRLDAPALEVNVDRTKAAYLGLTQRDVIQNVVTATNSSISFAKSFWIDPRNGNHYFIGAQYPEDQMRSFDTLLDIPLTGAKTTEPVLLRNVATVERTTLPAVINHRNITRTYNIYVNVEGRDIGSVADEIETVLATSAPIQELRKRYEPQGYRVSMRGEVRSMRESFGQFGLGLGIAVILTYLVLTWQFRSFRDPLVILATVPLGLLGVVVALAISGTAISIPSFMGAIMTIGLGVDYSVLLVDFIGRLRREGVPLHEAVTRAAGLRLRPILMTALAASAAMVPLSIGASANAALARAIIGGIAFASLSTLFIVPALYVAISGRRTFEILPEELA